MDPTYSHMGHVTTLKLGGIDGCTAGWLLAASPIGQDEVETRIFSTFAELLAERHGFAVFAIDIPIGLTDEGPRPTDRAARAILGARARSVFPAPVRAALKASTYEEACERSFAAHGKKLSTQTFAIMPKIREVDELLRAKSATAVTVREIHPEVSFCFLNCNKPMTHPKRTGLGFAERHKLVHVHFPGAFERARITHSRSQVADDDILDALAALWTARRLEKSQAHSLPDGELQYDSMGLPMAIWA